MKRKRETVKDLAKSIATELARNANDVLFLEIDRGWSIEPDLGLSATTKEKLGDFHSILNRQVPDDFLYCVNFQGGEVSGMLEFQDGMMAAAGRDFPVRFDRNFLENLREIDWDELRSQAMSMTQSMESQVSGPVPDWFKEHIASKRNKG